MPRRKKKSKAAAVADPNAPRRWFGEYKCSECNRYWASAWCWDDFGQKCRTCNIEVMPFRKRPLRRRKNKKADENTEEPSVPFVDPNKPHLSYLCGKCRVTGRCNKRYNE